MDLAGHPLQLRLRAWRAGRIRDPVARLRYLRIAGGLPLFFEDPPRAARHSARQIAAATVLLLVFAGKIGDARWEAPAEPPRPTPPVAPVGGSGSRVWFVERRGNWETYSNGLYVDVSYQTAGEPRLYPIFDPESLEIKAWGHQPVGIVFHSTESQLAPFEPRHTRQLLRLGTNLLEYLRRNRVYHYLIDRFGRVYRVVQDEHVANHAGYSVWKDQAALYINLNGSFIGIAFEARTGDELSQPETTEAQLRAARLLVEMLRSRYGIPAQNCVTHAQVSVNPRSLRVGNHLDWADGLPYRELGLPDNYRIASPAVALFGFQYDPVTVERSRSGFAECIRLGRSEMERRARAAGLTAEQYAARMRQRYQEILRWLGQRNLNRETRYEFET